MTSTKSNTDGLRPGDALSIDLALLDANPFQPRSEMDPAKLDELGSSIARTGLIQPIAVRPKGPGRYEIVAGHRRVAAFRKLLAAAKSDSERRTYELIRAHVVAAVSDSQMAVGAYVENAQRDNLNPLDEAAALANIRMLGGHATSAQVAEATGQPERRVRRLLRLFAAPAVVKECVSLGLLVETSESDAAPKRERRKLDLLAALEFSRLHEHHARKKPTTADERTITAMARALTHNWGLRRIQTWVDGVLSGIEPKEVITDTHLADAARSVPPKDKGTDERSAHESEDICSSSSERFTLYLSRLKAASTQQLEAARVTIEDIRQLVEAQLSARNGRTAS